MACFRLNIDKTDGAPNKKPGKPSAELLALIDDEKNDKTPNKKQTAFTKEQKGDEIKYEGYSNPYKQSRSFRILESNLHGAEKDDVIGKYDFTKVTKVKYYMAYPSVIVNEHSLSFSTFVTLPLYL